MAQRAGQPEAVRSHHSSSGKSSGKGGKGSKGKGFNLLSNEWPQMGSGAFPTLCTVTTKNRYAALQEKEEEVADFHRMGSSTLADFMPVQPSSKVTQREKKCARAPQAKWPSSAQVDGTPRLCPLVTVEPRTLAPVQQERQPEWVPMEIAVDSGASETVIPTDALPNIDLASSEYTLSSLESLFTFSSSWASSSKFLVFPGCCLSCSTHWASR